MAHENKTAPATEHPPLLRWSDMMVSVTIFTGAIICCTVLNQATAESADSAHVPLIFVLAVALISRMTDGYFWGVLCSLISVFFVNYYFTYPFHAFNFTLSGYPLTFLSMLAVSLIISAATTQIKRQEALRAKAEQELLRANLLRAVSHDIRTPLTSIIGASSTLLEHGEALDEEQKTILLSDINEDAHWLVRVVENLLSITRISGRTELSKTPELIEDVMAETVQKFQKSYPAVEVEVSAPREVLLVPMDATLIEQVIFNLMENSARHGGTTTRVRLAAEKVRGRALVRIADNGRGIAPEKLEAIRRGDFAQLGGGAPDARRSMGIGLSVCRTIIHVHGGELSARNLPGGGAEFSFTLPLEEGDSHEDQG